MCVEEAIDKMSKHHIRHIKAYDPREGKVSIVASASLKRHLQYGVSASGVCPPWYVCPPWCACVCRRCVSADGVFQPAVCAAASGVRVCPRYACLAAVCVRQGACPLAVCSPAANPN